MFESAKKSWQAFKASEPGHRFQDRYWRRKKESRGSFQWSKAIYIMGGLLLTAVGLFLMPAPGPGGVVVIAGLALLGSEFLVLARLMDWAEPKVRAVATRVADIWRKTTAPVKAVLIIAGLMSATAAAWAAWHLFLA